MKKVLLSLLVLFAVALTLNSCIITESCKHDDPTQIVICEAKEATCQETGLTEGMKCNLCGVMTTPQVAIPMLECIPGEWIIDKESTKTEDGLKHNECTVCGNKISELVISAGSVGLEYRVRSSGDSCAITGIGTCTDSEIVIPPSIDGYKVTKIDDAAFKDSTLLTKITIPDSVASIGGSSFFGCTSLTSVTIPDSMASIGGYAFSGCTSLTSIIVPDSVTNISITSFYGCTSLVYNKHDNGYYIGSTNNPYHILIKPINKLISSCEIHENTKVIAGNAFSSCAALESIIIPDSVAYIGSYAFKGCTLLTSINLPDGVTNIGDYTFYDCGLVSIIIPEGVTSIGANAFGCCTTLTNIIIPASVTSICASAFWDCSSLKRITIPDSVTSIDVYAFGRCTSLTSICYDSTIERWNLVSKENTWASPTEDYTIFCTDGEITKDGTITYYTAN